MTSTTLPTKIHTPINRRTFLGAAGAGLVAPLLLPGKARGANERITMGVIGVGSRGVQVMMDGFVTNPEVAVLAVCDVQRQRCEEAAGMVNAYYENDACAVYNDFRDLLARDDIDTLMITAPDHWHGVMATHAAEAGKDMYCEKPLGVSVRDGLAIRDAVRRHDIIFQTGLQQRSGRNFRHACELVRGGYLGAVDTIEVAAPGPSFAPRYDGPLDGQPVPPGLDWDLYVGPAPMTPYNPGRLEWPDWYLIWDYCAGFIVNWGIHHLDIAAWGCPTLLAAPFEVTCTGDYRNEGLTDNINGWRAEYAYPDGLKLLYSDTDNPYRQGVCFRGEEGWVHVNRRDIEAEPASLLDVVPSEEARLYKSDHHARDFIQSVKERRDPVAPVETGCQAGILGFVAEIAARLERPVRWDAATETIRDDAQAASMLARTMRDPWTLA